MEVKKVSCKGEGCLVGNGSLVARKSIFDVSIQCVAVAYCARQPTSTSLCMGSATVQSRDMSPTLYYSDPIFITDLFPSPNFW